MKKVSKAALIRVELAEGMAVKDIATLLDIREDYVAQVKWHWQGGKKKKKYKKVKKPSKLLKAVDDANKMFEVEPPKEWLEEYTSKVNALLHEKMDTEVWNASFGVGSPDPVNSPPHYTAGGIETIDFIEAKGLNYHLGNCVKYLSRAGLKTEDTLEDLKKAAWYLNREIENLEFKIADKEWAENT